MCQDNQVPSHAYSPLCYAIVAGIARERVPFTSGLVTSQACCRLVRVASDTLHCAPTRHAGTKSHFISTLVRIERALASRALQWHRTRPHTPGAWQPSDKLHTLLYTFVNHANANLPAAYASPTRARRRHTARPLHVSTEHSPLHRRAADHGHTRTDRHSPPPYFTLIPSRPSKRVRPRVQAAKVSSTLWTLGSSSRVRSRGRRLGSSCDRQALR